MRLLVLTLGIVLMLPGVGVQASGLIFPIGGARAQGMAGAWVAQGDDLSVLDHNPAQLIRQEKFAAELHYFAFHYDARFDPAPVEGLGDGAQTKNSGNFVNHIPNILVAYPINDQWVIGGGLFTPYGPRQTFEDDGPQRYQIQQTRISLVWPTASVAYRPVSAFTMALSLDVGYAFATQKLAIPLVLGMRTLEGRITVDGKGKPTPRAKVGLLYTPDDHWSIGAVFAHGIDITINGTIEVDFPQVGFTSQTANDKISASQRYPLEARLGVGWQNEAWRAEVAVRYFNFSEYTEQFIDLKNNQIGPFEFEDITIAKDYRNTFAAQAGAGFKPIDHHEIRMGYGFDQGASRDSTLGLSDYDSNRHYLAVGYGIDFDRVYGNIGYTRVIFHDRTITDSDNLPISILGEDTSLHNGVYSWAVNLFGINAGVRF